VRKRRGGPPPRLLRIVSQTAGEGNYEFLVEWIVSDSFYVVAGANLLIAISFAIFRRAVPARSAVQGKQYSVEELRRRFRHWSLLEILPGLAFIAALGFLWYEAFKLLAMLYYRGLGSAVYLFHPPDIAWMFAGGFLGLVTAV